MKALLKTAACAAAVVLAAGVARGAFIIEIDTDGLDDGVLTFNPRFSFGGDTTTASQSAAATAVGLTGGDSIFGGDGVNLPDTYRYTYTPGTDVDNFSPNPGDPLNDDGNVATGIPGGGTGTYNVYATWPITTNVGGGPTTYQMTHDGGMLSTQIDQNTRGDEWYFLGTADLTAGQSYTLEQLAGSNAFVSMRASAVMFEAVPEPSALALAGVAGLALLRRARRCR